MAVRAPGIACSIAVASTAGVPPFWVRLSLGIALKMLEYLQLDGPACSLADAVGARE